MNFDAYDRQGRIEYKAFAETVAAILTVALGARPDLRLQQVRHREKSPDSLKKKLGAMNGVDPEKIEDSAKDLAGCRLVFYTNSDVERFLASSIINENFEIDWDRTKFHHPVPGTDTAESLFQSTNFVVKLKRDRVALPEYSRFRGMHCEIQVQTILNHAWSEMAHDTIYKGPALTGFGGKLMEGIKARMTKIMREYLLPAGYEFQQVVGDYERLSSGKEMFDKDALKALAECKDNNELHDALQRFSTYVLPYYDDLPSRQATVRNAIVAAVEKAREGAVRPLDTPFGALPGHTISQITKVAVDVLDSMRYLGVEAIEATFDSICKFFPGAQGEEERKALLELTKNLSKHELHVWKQAGPLVQQILLDKISRLDKATLNNVRPVVLEVLEQALQPDVTGTSSTYKTLTIHTGSVSPSEMLDRVRAGAIRFLKKLFLNAESDGERAGIVHTLSVATRKPQRYSEPLLKTVLSNTVDVVEFYVEQADRLSYELMEKLEQSLLWLYRNNCRAAESTGSDPEIGALRRKLGERIFAFRDAINGNREFVTYKTLVGFESVFPGDWESDGSDFEKSEKYRNERISEFVNEVNEKNADEWLQRLSRCAQTESDDLATFPSFGRFLQELSRTKPNIMLGFLDRLPQSLVRFLPAILHGLEGLEEWKTARSKIGKWIDEKRYLGEIIWQQRHSAELDSDVLIRATKAAIETSNDSAVTAAVDVSIARYDDIPEDSLIGQVFVPSVSYLGAKGNTRWAGVAWMRTGKTKLFRNLSAEQADTVLTLLARHPQVDHRIERMLGAIAEVWPMKIVAFFALRLKTEPTVDSDRYEAIPYQFHSLHETLAKMPEAIVSASRVWFEEDKGLFAYRGGRLLSIVFPILTPEVAKCLQALVKIGEESDLEFVVKVLGNYNGKLFTHDTYKSVVERLPAEHPLLSDIAIGLDSAGVVSGEFGFVEALKQKKAEIEPWLTDAREAVKAFARRHILSLDRQIASEQRRGEGDLERRKREWGEDPASKQE